MRRLVTLPNGSRFKASLARESARRNLVTHRGYALDAQSVYSYSTDYDLIGRPTNAVDSISSARAWLYNNRSELVGATVGTSHYGYDYDTIGNRTWSAVNTATNTYTANTLNQYTGVQHSTFNIQPSYDADGNLTNDGTFSYAYDAENRLVSTTSAVETNGAIRVLNAYDHRNRRIRKTVQRLLDTNPPPPSTPTGTREWQTVETHVFVWDGNNIVLEKIVLADGTSHMVEYFWGSDLSGTEQGAGGVGGLLAVSRDGVFHIPCYDHNGNVVLYMSETGAIAAEYVYDPYGNIVETYGTLASQFAFGFSTKYHDREIGMIAYQRRFYRPDIGRWLNRDPIEEEGGENLYAFCLSNPVAFCDVDGELVITGPMVVPSGAPSWWNQLGDSDAPLNEEQWFESRYPHLLAEARRRFTEEINGGIDCSKKVFEGKSSRVNLDPGVAGDWPWQDCVGGNDSQFGDDGQSSWEAIALLGKFSVDYVTPVYISYSCENGKRTYNWTTTMYIADTLGLQGDEGLLGKYLGWAAKSRQVKRAQWTLTGSGVCK